MKQKFLALFMAFALCALTLPPLIGVETHVQLRTALDCPDQRTGKITKSYRRERETDLAG